MFSGVVYPVACSEVVNSLLARYAFSKTYWRAIRTTNPIERVNKEMKSRTKVMESLGEKILDVVVAFVALKLEYNWRRNPVNAEHFGSLNHVRQSDLEEAV